MGKFDSDEDASFNPNDLSLTSEKREKTAITIALSTIVLPLWALWILFLTPGKFLLWKEYNFPKYGKVYATGRRNKSSTVAVIYAIRFWFLAALFISPVVYAKCHWTETKQLYAEASEAFPIITLPQILIGNLLKSQLPQVQSQPEAQPQFSLLACSDPSILVQVKNIIANSEKIDPNSVNVNNINQTDFNQQSQRMNCTALMSTPNDSYSIRYVETWLDQSQGKWYVQVFHG